MAQCLDFTRFRIFQALFHFKTGVAHLSDTALADNRVVKQHGMAKVQVHMDKNILECEPIDWRLEDMLEVSASAHVEEVALRPVVDVIVRVKVAHSDLDWTGEHVSLEFRV